MRRVNVWVTNVPSVECEFGRTCISVLIRHRVESTNEQLMKSTNVSTGEV